MNRNLITNIGDLVFKESKKSGQKYLIQDPYVYMGETTDCKVMDRIDFRSLGLFDMNLGTRDQFLALLSDELLQMGYDKRVVLDSVGSKAPSVLDALYDRWYADRDPEWLYSHPDYVFETVHCALHVSSQFKKSGLIGKNCPVDNTLRTLHHLGYDRDSNLKILDLGAGLGVSTLFLSTYFPHSTIYYNELNPQSRRLFSRLKSTAGCRNIVELSSHPEDIPDELDIVLALEFVEHLPLDGAQGVGDPLTALEPILKKICSQGLFMYYTMWNSEWNNEKTLGHFLSYKFDEDVLTYPQSDKTKKCHTKLFQNSLKCRGFERLNHRYLYQIEDWALIPEFLPWDFKGHSPWTFKKR